MDTDSFSDIRATAATVCSLLQVTPPDGAFPANDAVLSAAQAAFGGAACDRVFLYNPDAIALWLYEKYAARFAPLEQPGVLRLPMRTVFPPVTPVCFASMYSGLAPEAHGIRKYEKPVLRVPTIFDALPAAGRRTAIVCTEGDSIARIFLDRSVDYFFYRSKQACNAKALELIRQDAYSCIVLYNGDYDYWMHRCSPEGRRALRALNENIDTCCTLRRAIAASWQAHNSVLAFAPDHGCHRVYGFFGTHGIDAPCDRETVHFYSFLPAAARAAQ